MITREDSYRLSVLIPIWVVSRFDGGAEVEAMREKIDGRVIESGVERVR